MNDPTLIAPTEYPGKFPSLAHLSDEQIEDEIDAICACTLTTGNMARRLEHADLVEELHTRRPHG
jgi:hypothetical protein